MNKTIHYFWFGSAEKGKVIEMIKKDFESLGYEVSFINDKLINNSILIIIAIYIVLYVIFEIIKYKKFEKYEDKLHDRYR